MDWIGDPDAWLALATLTALEIVLGIDNIVFISILVGRLDPARRQSARIVGLTLAMAMRILLLLSIAWVVSLTAPLFRVAGREISGRDLVLIGGGLFLIGKSTREIHHRTERQDEHAAPAPPASFLGTLAGIALLDVVFSLDSVITAVGMADRIAVMVAAVVLAVVVMMVFARAVGEFIDAHPSLKMLALAFLLLIGTALIADGLDLHIPKGYIYFAMGFSLFVEILNQRSGARRAAGAR
ncbi:MAG: TerC family protein [Acidobacteria bacterium]|nr:MAG: TerC family protein [Acidobacteriota bacterium]